MLFKMLRKMLRVFIDDERADVASDVVGVVVALFILGAVGATAVIMASNATIYLTEGASVPAPVVAVFTVAVPVMAGVAIMMHFIPKRS